LGLLKEGQELQYLLVEAVREHNVLPLTGTCNLSCVFCSHKHNPPLTRAFSFQPLPEEKWSDLINYLDSDRKIVIGESATRLREGEPFTHPHILTVIEKIRRLHPLTRLQVTTNASLLNKEIIDRLTGFQPLELVLSLNSATEKGRRLLMNDPEPQKALSVPEMLCRSGLPFHGSLVALPHLVGYEDLRHTINLLDQAGADTVRILRPGYTKLSSTEIIPPPGTDQELENLVASLENNLQTVLVLEPPLLDNLEPIVKGVIFKSKAYQAGIRRGDRIDQVDGKKPQSRVDAFQMINGKKPHRLVIWRHDQFCRVELEKNDDQVSGLVFDYDLDFYQVETVRRRQVLGGKTLMLISEPSLALWKTALEKFKLTNLVLKTVRSKFFGGSINCAGLLTVADFSTTLEQAYKSRYYNAVILPAVAFDSAGNDLSGMHYQALTKQKIPIYLA